MTPQNAKYAETSLSECHRRKWKQFRTLVKVSDEISGPTYVKKGLFGGPDRDRTDDLFHAMEARSQLRHRPTLRRDSPILGHPGH